jgi:hypothetical protein
MPKLFRAWILGAVLIVAAGGSPAAAASLRPAADGTATSVSPAVKICGTGPAVRRPGSMILTCADDGELGTDLHWSNWTATRAAATGFVTWRACTQKCAYSRHWRSASADFTLTDPTAEQGKDVLFTRLDMHVTGPTPQGFMRDLAFDEAPTSAAPATARAPRGRAVPPPAAPSGTLGYDQIQGFWVLAGGPTAQSGSYNQAQIAAAITGAESSFYPGIIQPDVDYCGSGSDKAGWGLWQITCGNSVPQYGSDFQVLDPWNNAEAAVYKCKEDMAAGYNCFTPWSTWASGAYTNYLSDTAADTALTDPGEYVQVNSTPSGTPSSPGPDPGSTYGPPIPGARFTTSMGYMLQDQPVTFDASGSSAAPGASISSYSWDFGDGTTASGAVVSHDFVTSAPVTITLTVTQSNGQRSSASESYFVLPSDSSASNYVSAGVNQEHLFYESSAKALDQTWWNTSNWINQSMTGSPQSDPVTLNYNSAEHVFFIGSGGTVDQDFWNGTAWVPQTLPGTAAAGSAIGGTDYITSDGTLQQHVFFIGSDGSLEQTWWTGSTWDSQDIPGAPVTGSPIVSSLYISNGTLQQHVFFIGAGDTLQQTFWNGSDWVNQAILGSPVLGQNTLAVSDYVSAGVLQQHVFFIGAGNTLQQTFWNGNVWVTQAIPGAPAPAGGLVTSDFDPNQQHVFFTGSGNTLWQTFWNGTDWVNQTIPGSAARVLAANDYPVAGKEQHVFFSDPSGALQQTFWNGSAWISQPLPGPAVNS